MESRAAERKSAPRKVLPTVWLKQTTQAENLSDHSLIPPGGKREVLDIVVFASMGHRADTGEMSSSNKTMGQPLQIPRFRPRVALGWRAMVVVWLVCHLLYTPIHLVLESHADELHPVEAASVPTAVACFDHDDSHRDDHHEWHPSSQHSFEAVNSNRLVVVSKLVMVAMPWLEAVEGFFELQEPPECRRPGPAPPELTRGWQFYTRAAPPVRAPSILS